jgi:soluble lytic murein transglycosylase-like protein
VEDVMRKVMVWIGALVATLVACAVVFALCDVTAAEAEAEESRPVPVRMEPMAEYDADEALARIRREEAERMAVRMAGRERPTDDGDVTRLTEAVVELQPWYRKRGRSARRLADIIYTAAREHGVDPFLALSMAYRESSLLPSVGRGERVGALGEEGYFQVMPSSYPRRVCGEGRNMGQPRANADTAMCYVAHVREVCESHDPWVYVAAYGMRGCPSPERARQLPSPRRRRETLCTVVGDTECDTIWPQ